MSELTDWGQTTLGKHCVICTGKKDVNEGEMFGIYPFFTCSRNHIYSNKFSFNTEALLIAGNGEVGNVEYYKGKFEAYQRTYVLDNFNINIQYVYHLLKYSLKDTLSRSHAGSVIQFIKLEDLTEFTFFYPKDNLEILRIVKILDTIDTAIQQTQAIINKLKQLKQGLLHDLLTRGVDAKGELRPCYEDAPHLYKDSPLGWIPKEWEVVMLDDVAIRGSGHTPNKSISSYWNGGIKWVSLADSSKLDKIYIEETDKEISNLGIANSSAVLHPKGTVILSRDAGVGKSAILFQEMAVSQHFMAWRCSEKLNNLFLYFYLQREKPKFEGIAIGSTIKTIGLSFFKSYNLTMPPRIEQNEIVKILMNIEHNLTVRISELEKLQNQKAALMDDLLTGRIRVTSLLQTEASST